MCANTASRQDKCFYNWYTADRHKSKRHTYLVPCTGSGVLVTFMVIQAGGCIDVGSGFCMNIVLTTLVVERS
jgi:hypothetical protein